MNQPKSPEVIANEQQIRSTVVEAFLETGKAVDAAQIAERLGWSVSKVRRVLKDAHGCVTGLVTYQEGRQSHSRDYPAFTAGAHKVWVYEPGQGTLRALILELRAAASLVGVATPVQDPK